MSDLFIFLHVYNHQGVPYPCRENENTFPSIFLARGRFRQYGAEKMQFSEFKSLKRKTEMSDLCIFFFYIFIIIRVYPLHVVKMKTLNCRFFSLVGALDKMVQKKYNFLN